MPHVKIAFVGFGNVGKALAQLMIQKETELLEQYDLTFTVMGIATGKHGTAINAQGIDLKAVLEILGDGEQKDIAKLTAGQAAVNSIEFIEQCDADVLFENTPVNYETGQPAVDHIRRALKRGMHVVTANKGPVVHAHQELTNLASVVGRRFYFESAVMDGAPIFSLFREALPAARVNKFHGVLNSTTNLILTRMETGESFDQAVLYTQKIGIAETDPSGDIDGWDASVKVAALATVLMGIPLKPQDVQRQGIRHITPQMVADAAKQDKRWKLVCSASRTVAGIQANVHPELVERSSPMYAIEGTTSIIQFETDVLGRLSIIEENPGPKTTAYGCLADFVNAVRG